MFAAVTLIFGFLVTFVLSAGSRNKREDRANTPMLNAVGYVLCGLTAGAALILPMWAAVDPSAVVTLSQLG